MGFSSSKTTYIPMSERQGDQEARKIRRQERAQKLLDEANKQTERMRQLSAARRKKVTEKKIQKPKINNYPSESPSKHSNQQQATTTVTGPLLDDRNYPHGINRTNTIALETAETEMAPPLSDYKIPRGLDTDVAKNRERQSRIIEEIRRMKQ